MMTLIGIQREYLGEDILPLRVQGLANAAMIGVIYCNGFGGRCGEWCILKLRDFRAQMKKGRSYVLCQEHKTSHLYGDLAKWLAEGTKEAMTTYAALPRRHDCETFFHPSFEEVRTVDVHHALKRFGEKFLPECQQKPTVNLMRKWYHTKLVTVSKTEDELYKLMSRIDAHSHRVAAKHYVLQTPEHDANLAKILVEEVLGTTVPWPKEMEHLPWQKFKEKIKVMPSSVSPNEDSEVPDDPSEEEELPWFDLAHVWGLRDPLVPLPAAPTEHLATDDEVTPLDALAACDAPPVEPPEPPPTEAVPLSPTDPPAAEPSGSPTLSLTGPPAPSPAEAPPPSEPTEGVSQDSVVEVPLTVTSSQEITADAPQPAAPPMPRDVSPDQRTLRELSSVRFFPRPTPQAPAWKGAMVSPPQAFLRNIFAKQSPVKAKRTAEPKRTGSSAPMPSPPDDVSVIQSSPGTPRARSRSPSRPPTAPTPRSTPQRSGGERSRSRTRVATTPPSIKREDRRYRYQDEEVAYILKAHEAFPKLKPVSWFQDLLLQGRATGQLSMDATPNGMRSIVGRHLARREEERQREARELARAQARILRNERRRQQYAEGNPPA